MINILIADDNKDLLIILTSMLAKIDNAKIINISSNGEDAYNNIISLKPDFIILDLNMPKMTGIEILNNINIISNYYPKIIVISGYPELISKVKNKNNIHMLFYKGQSLDKIVNFIKNSILKEESKNQNNKILLNQLNMLNINIAAKGAKYIIEAVLIVNENPNLLENMEKGVFGKLALKYKTNVQNIKWNITRCINSMCRYSTKKEICEHFNLTNYIKPTPKFVITYLNNLL